MTPAGSRRRGRVNGVTQAGHPVTTGHRRHKHLAARGHRIQEVGPPVQEDAVLDGVRAMSDRRLSAGQPFGVRVAAATRARRP
jgi:hypothetical protein